MNIAVERYRKLLQQHPENELARFSLGKAYYDQGEFTSALAEFQLALARKPGWMAVQILIGRCELALGNRERAREAFTRARQLAIEQDHDGPRAEMEQALAELGDASAA